MCVCVYTTQALDYVIYMAGELGLKVHIALGNFWPAYKGPEEFVW